MQSLQEAIEKNRARKDIHLASGRTIRHHRMDNGAQDAIPTTGARELTEAEWQDYCQKLSPRT